MNYRWLRGPVVRPGQVEIAERPCTIMYLSLVLWSFEALLLPSAQAVPDQGCRANFSAKPPMTELRQYPEAEAKTRLCYCSKDGRACSAHCSKAAAQTVSALNTSFTRPPSVRSSTDYCRYAYVQPVSKECFLKGWSSIPPEKFGARKSCQRSEVCWGSTNGAGGVMLMRMRSRCVLCLSVPAGGWRVLRCHIAQLRVFWFSGSDASVGLRQCKV